MATCHRMPITRFSPFPALAPPCTLVAAPPLWEISRQSEALLRNIFFPMVLHYPNYRNLLRPFSDYTVLFG
jgi:hypothetical protein